MQSVGQKTMYDLRKEIFEHLQRLPMSFFDRSPVGRLVTRATTDVDALNDLFASGVVAMLNDFVLLFGAGRASAVPLAPVLGAGHAFSAAVHDSADVFLPQSRARRESAHSHRHRAHQCISAGTHQRHVRRAALQSRAKIAREQFAELNRIHMEAYKDAIDAFSFFYPAVEFLSMGGIALLYWVGGITRDCRDGCRSAC